VVVVIAFISRSFVICVCIALTSCETIKVPEPTSGSRADGTVKLSYEVQQFEKPIVQWDAAQAAAEQRCKAWGYQSAEKFGGQETHCNAFNGNGGCVDTFVTVQYQCTGTSPKS
jgi:hypothetical protein